MDSMKGIVSAVPSLGKLLGRLARDPRVPARSKIVFGAIAAYLLIPFDIVPDWIPGLGQVDDLLLVALALDAMVNRVPPELVEEHWDGEGDALDTIRSVLGGVTRFVPESLKRLAFPNS